MSQVLHTTKRQYGGFCRHRHTRCPITLPIPAQEGRDRFPAQPVKAARRNLCRWKGGRHRCPRQLPRRSLQPRARSASSVSRWPRPAHRARNTASRRRRCGMFSNPHRHPAPRCITKYRVNGQRRAMREAPRPMPAPVSQPREMSRGDARQAPAGNTHRGNNQGRNDRPDGRQPH